MKNLEDDIKKSLKLMDEVESDIEKLSAWIKKYRELFGNAKTEEDLKEIFNRKDSDIESKLKHIRIF